MAAQFNIQWQQCGLSYFAVDRAAVAHLQINYQTKTKTSR